MMNYMNSTYLHLMIVNVFIRNFQRFSNNFLAVRL